MSAPKRITNPADLLPQVAERIGKWRGQDAPTWNEMGELFELVGALAVDCMPSEDTQRRAKRITKRLLDIASLAVSLAYHGAHKAGYAPDHRWQPCTHDEAIAYLRAGYDVRAAHWPEHEWMRERDGEVQGPAAATRLSELLIGRGTYGGTLQWLVAAASEELPC